MRKVFCLLFLGTWLAAGGQDESSMQKDEDVVVVNYLIPQEPVGLFNAMLADEFNKSQARIRVEVIQGSASVTDLYALILQTFESQKDDIDIMNIDTIWSGDLAEHLVDLNPLGGDVMAAQMFDDLISNSTVDDRLVTLPVTNSAGLMLYRKDLLEKYGYSEAPSTWSELEEMATKVQQEKEPQTLIFGVMSGRGRHTKV